MRIALATAIAATGLDDDMPLLVEACGRAGIDAQVLAWDDATVSWSRFDAVLLRSTWDYTDRLPQFLRWCERIDRVATLVNPLPVVHWNTDKHYLADLARAGVPVVPGSFVEPDAEPLPALQAFFAEHAQGAEFVVKPAIGAGSRDAQRYTRAQEFAAGNHIARLLDAGRSVLLQPYLTSVDTQGETALLYFDGAFSHAIRKGPLLRTSEAATSGLFAPEAIMARVPDEDERRAAENVLAAMHDHLGLHAPLAYARVDLIRNHDGRPQLLELELAEPSFFLAHAPGAAERLLAGLVLRINASRPTTRVVDA